MKNNKPIIMLVPRLLLPIPAIEGGAIETLITSLIDINEVEQKAYFVVVSKFSREAKKHKYKFTKIYYFKNNRRTGVKGLFEFFKEICLKVWDKVFRNHISGKIFGYAYDRDFVSAQIYRIGKKNKVDYVSLEAYQKENEMCRFNKLVGEKCVCNHIHYARKEDINARRLIGNSISISKYVRDYWAQDKTIEGYNEILYNGIDISLFSKKFSEDHKTALRTRLGFSEKDVIVIFVGRILEVKGITELLDAFDRIRDEHIKLLLIGEGPVGYGYEYVEYVKNRLNGMSNVKYLGYIPNNVLPEYYAISDIQIVPSTCQEGAGLVAIEGMSQGLPLIITKSGGMTEYVDEKCSIQIPINDKLSKNIESSLLELAYDCEKRRRMGLIGAEIVKQFDKNKYYGNFIAIVEKYIKKEK